MRRDKVILTLGILFTITAIGLAVLLDDTNKYHQTAPIILSIGMAYIPISFIIKKRIESPELMNDERIQKIGTKSICWSWFISVILTGALSIINIIPGYAISGTHVLSLTFTTMMLSYALAYLYYRNKKV